VKRKKTTIDFWKAWWDERAKPSISDREIDRGSARVLDELERRSKQQFLEAIDPKKDDLVLDAGCGTGANFSAISSSVHGIVGLDFSGEQLKRAEKRIAADKLSNVKLALGSVTQIDFGNSTFDKVICTSVLQYLNDEECETACREMIRVCKDGGIIVIHAKNRTSVYGVLLRVQKFIARRIGRKTTPDYYRPRAWYGKTLAKYGGEIVDFDAFGIFNFSPLPFSAVHRLLKLEMKWIKSKKLKAFGVNYKMTVRVTKAGRQQN